MDDAIHAPPQPGSPEQAQRVLPFKVFSLLLLAGLVFCILGVLAFAWLAKSIFADRFVAFDDSIITWLHSRWGPFSDQAMMALTTIGAPLVVTIVVTLAAAGLWRIGRWIDAIVLAVTAGGGGLLNILLKDYFQRVRPDLFPGPLHLTSYSFPSGHAMGSIICYGMLAFLGMRLLRRRLARLALGFAATLLILGIGLSRVYFGVHYPTDVVGGYLAGAIWMVFAISVIQSTERYMHYFRASKTTAESRTRTGIHT